MINVELDIIQTAGIGALALIVGMFLTRRINFLQKFCVPSPVSGGIIFSLITLVLYGWFDVEVSFDGTLKDVFMVAFFTSVGFQSDLKVLKRGGKLLIIMLVLLVIIITMQNLMPMGITRLMGVEPLIGMASGSISMTGGHGTAGGFAGVLENMGLQGAGTIAMAAATFGLIAGSMLGGPLAERIIRKKLTQEQMQPIDEEIDPAMAGIESDEASPTGRTKRISTNEQEFQQYAKAFYCIILVMGAGTLLSWLLEKTGITFPTYFGALILAAIVRNTIGFVSYKENGKWENAEKLLDMERIISVGNICLSLFLGMAMISLKLWELQHPAIDHHSGVSGAHDGTVCLLCGIPSVRSRLRCCRLVCRNLRFRTRRHPQCDGKHECRMLQIPLYRKTLSHHSHHRSHVRRLNQYRYDHFLPQYHKEYHVRRKKSLQVLLLLFVISASFKPNGTNKAYKEIRKKQNNSVRCPQ